MLFLGNDEQTLYALLALDMLKDAYKSYNASVKAARAVLHEHGFSEKEIESLIEMSKSE